MVVHTDAPVFVFTWQLCEVIGLDTGAGVGAGVVHLPLARDALQKFTPMHCSGPQVHVAMFLLPLTFGQVIGPSGPDTLLPDESKLLQMTLPFAVAAVHVVYDPSAFVVVDDELPSSFDVVSVCVPSAFVVTQVVESLTSVHTF
jgi:hypothetical protein